jgi:transcriptional regulator with XRE-family HTH domain
MLPKEKSKYPERLNRIDEVLSDIERSRKWLSDKTSINYRTVVRYCNNEAQPRLDMLKRIAQVLEVKMCDLINDA